MAPSADWDSFSLWLEGNKIDLPGTGLSIGKVAEGHGLVATRNIAVRHIALGAVVGSHAAREQEGEKILSIPTTVMMSTKGARSALAKLIEADKTFMVCEITLFQSFTLFPRFRLCFVDARLLLTSLHVLSLDACLNDVALVSLPCRGLLEVHVASCNEKQNIGAVQMTMFIIHELHKEYTDSPSFFIPYLRTLPKTLTLPIFWSVDEIKRLAPSTVLGVLKAVLRTAHACLPRV